MNTPTLTDTAPVTVAPAADKPKGNRPPPEAVARLCHSIIAAINEHPEKFPPEAYEQFKYPSAPAAG